MGQQHDRQGAVRVADVENSPAIHVWDQFNYAILARGLDARALEVRRSPAFDYFGCHMLVRRPRIARRPPALPIRSETITAPPATLTLSLHNISPPRPNPTASLRNLSRSFPGLSPSLCNNSCSLPDPSASFCNPSPPLTFSSP